MRRVEVDTVVEIGRRELTDEELPDVADDIPTPLFPVRKPCNTVSSIGMKPCPMTRVPEANCR